MPGVRTAAQLVRQAREHMQEMSTATYRDGFSTDPDTSTGLIAILSFVNQALTIFSQAGVAKDEFPVPVASGVREVQIPNTIGKIIRHRYVVTSTGAEYSLRDISLEDLESRIRDWPRRPQGLPNLAIQMGDKIMLYPTPNDTYAGTLNLWATSLLADLVNPTDIPSRLPTRHHDATGMLAAMLACASDATNPARAARIPELMVLWQGQDEDLKDVIDARAVIDAMTRKGG